MRKHAKNARKSAKKFRRLSLSTIIVAAAILAIGAVAIGAVAISGRKPEVKRASNPASNPERKTPVTNNAGKKFVTVKMAGQDVQVDGQTGQIRELTPEEAQKLAAGLKQLVNKSTDDLESVHHADGSESIDLKGRFQSVTVAKIDADGNLVQSCVDSPRAAAEFFGIDPKLIENAPEDRTQPTRVAPVENKN